MVGFGLLSTLKARKGPARGGVGGRPVTLSVGRWARCNFSWARGPLTGEDSWCNEWQNDGIMEPINPRFIAPHCSCSQDSLWFAMCGPQANSLLNVWGVGTISHIARASGLMVSATHIIPILAKSEEGLIQTNPTPVNIHAPQTHNRISPPFFLPKLKKGDPTFCANF